MDTLQRNIMPALLSLGLHVVLFGFLLLGMDFKPKEQKKAQKAAPVVQATMIDASKVKAVRNQIREREEKKLNEEAARKRRAENTLQEAKRKREQEEKRMARLKQQRQEEERKAQLAVKKRAAEEKKLAEKAKQRKAAEEAARVAKQAAKEAEEKRKRQEQRAAELKAQREKEERERKEREAARQRREALEKQIQQELAQEEVKAAARERFVLSEIEKYTLLIKNKITQNWIKPPNVKRCVLIVKVGPGGIVVDVNQQSGDAVTCQSATNAVYKSTPLPIPQDPEIFAKMRQIRYTFTEDD